MTARWITADVFDGLATLDDASVDLVVTSPPFLALRSYLPADHPDKAKEIGSEPTPAAFIDTLLAVTAELRRVLAPHGSIAVELGDTYAGSGGAGGDYGDQGLREGQPKFEGSSGRRRRAEDVAAGILAPTKRPGPSERDNIAGWPLAKSKTLIPELYRLALAYGINPLTGQESPAGRWRVRNVVTWCRPNPPVGALGDKWRPATSDIVIACTSDKRYWDDISTRVPSDYDRPNLRGNGARASEVPGQRKNMSDHTVNAAGAPLLDYWELPPGGYPGSHYAVYPPALVEPLIKAMAPPRVCRTCGEPSRRIVERQNPLGARAINNRRQGVPDVGSIGAAHHDPELATLGWSDCPCWHRTHRCTLVRGAGVVGNDACDCGKYRPAHILDPFAGSGTTLAVATGHGHTATGIDLDPRNRDLAYERIGPFLFSE